MIVEKVETKHAPAAGQKYIKWKGKMIPLLQVGMQLSRDVEIFDFRKLARHEATDPKTRGVWDHFGSVFVIVGEKPPGLFDKAKRSIRFYSMFGETLE